MIKSIIQTYLYKHCTKFRNNKISAKAIIGEGFESYPYCTISLLQNAAKENITIGRYCHFRGGDKFL